MPWVRGDKLSPELQRAVKDTFIYRWTKDNPHREDLYHGRGKPRLPLISDEEWLCNTEFHVVKDETRLSRSHRFCRTHVNMTRETKGD